MKLSQCYHHASCIYISVIRITWAKYFSGRYKLANEHYLQRRELCTTSALPVNLCFCPNQLSDRWTLQRCALISIRTSREEYIQLHHDQQTNRLIQIRQVKYITFILYSSTPEKLEWQRICSIHLHVYIIKYNKITSYRPKA